MSATHEKQSQIPAEPQAHSAEHYRNLYLKEKACADNLSAFTEGVKGIVMASPDGPISPMTLDLIKLLHAHKLL